MQNISDIYQITRYPSIPLYNGDYAIRLDGAGVIECICRRFPRQSITGISWLGVVAENLGRSGTCSIHAQCGLSLTISKSSRVPGYSARNILNLSSFSVCISLTLNLIFFILHIGMS